jgi:hypothetical protein
LSSNYLKVLLSIISAYGKLDVPVGVKDVLLGRQSEW